MTRLVIADDDRLVREGLKLVVARTTDIEVVGEARNGKEAIELAETKDPDVISMDLDMPRLGGLRAAAQIHLRRAAVRMVIVSSAWDEHLLRQALENGATGYIAKIEMFGEIIPAVRAAAKGKTYFSASISKMMSEATLDPTFKEPGFFPPADRR